MYDNNNNEIILMQIKNKKDQKNKQDNRLKWKKKYFLICTLQGQFSV